MLPNIVGDFGNAYRGYVGAGTGAFKGTTARNRYKDWGGQGSQEGYDGANFAANNSNSLYGGSNSVQPPAAQVLIIIKT